MSDGRKVVALVALSTADALATLREAQAAVPLDAPGVVIPVKTITLAEARELYEISPPEDFQIPEAALPGRRRKRKGTGRHKARRWFVG